MAWFLLLVAGALEVVWAVAMKQSAGFTKVVPSAVTLIAMIASVGLLALAMRALPLGTAYAVWTGSARSELSSSASCISASRPTPCASRPRP